MMEVDMYARLTIIPLFFLLIIPNIGFAQEFITSKFPNFQDKSFIAFMDQKLTDGGAYIALSSGINPVGTIFARKNTNSLQIWEILKNGKKIKRQELPFAGASFGKLLKINKDDWYDLVTVVEKLDGRNYIKVFCGAAPPEYLTLNDCGLPEVPLYDDYPGAKGKLISIRAVDFVKLADNIVASAVSFQNANPIMEGNGTRPEHFKSFAYRVKVTKISKTGFSSKYVNSSFTSVAKDFSNLAELEFLTFADLFNDGKISLVLSNGQIASFLDSSPLPAVLILNDVFSKENMSAKGLYYQLTDAQASGGNYNQPRRVIVADMDNDKRKDIVVINYGVNDWENGSPAVMFQNSKNDWDFVATDISAGGEPIEGTVADIDGNGLLDIIAMSSDRNGFEILGQTSKRKFKMLDTIKSTHRDWVLAGDYNGDQLTDLLIGSETGFKAFEPSGGFSPFGEVSSHSPLHLLLQNP